MNKKYFGLVGFAALTVSGCVIVNEERVVTNAPGFAEFAEEPIYAARVEAEGVYVTVRSNGCTNKSQFDVDVDEERDRVYSAAFRRIQADRCASDPQGRDELYFSYSELGVPAGADLFVRNPLARGAS
ncbi:MAG: hypothetical protein ACFB2Z_02375 [Maricaulaceae bacterium]